MTHDELLAQPEKDFKLYSSNQKYGAVFRAVVELHKPISSEYFEKDVCRHCSPDIDYFEFYPCPTIRAIEGELA